MKLSTTLALTIGAGVVAFLAGRLTQHGQISGNTVPSAGWRKSSVRANPAKSSRETANSAIRAMGKYASCSQEFSAENAAKLSSDERLELLATGASVGDYGNQAAMLCGLISVLTREELSEATDILDGMQARGNSQAPDVWKSLWNQWGRLAPEECFSLFNKDPSDKSPADARNVMTGWLEIHADDALAWSMEPGKSDLEAAAAALAISRGVGGDLGRLESAILKLPEDCATVQACLEDYFDVASLAGSDQAAKVYEKLPQALRSAAWSVAAKRIGYEDSETAKAWVMDHGDDPGRDYSAIDGLFDTLAHEDPAGVVKWAVRLPFATGTNETHPGMKLVFNWYGKDPEAASAWIKTQPQDAPWLPVMLLPE